MRDAVDPKGPLSYRSSLETISLVIMPYLCFAITALTTLLDSYTPPVFIEFYFIALSISPLWRYSREMAVSIVCLVALVVAAIFGSWTSILLARNCTTVREHGVDFTFMLRVFAFGLYVVLGLCLNGLAISDWTSPLPDLFLSTFSIIVCLIFGSQRDILITWQDGVAQCVTSLFSCCLSFAWKLSSLNRSGHGHVTPRIDIMVDVQTATQTSHGSSSFATLTPYPFHLQSQRCEKGSNVSLARSVGRAMDGNGSGSLCNATPPIPGSTSPNSARDLSS
ncbi:hypothetical protein GLOTRDRAFT_133925 [Gloeophyllum trabeum ATCC 11539]|uniref:Uncharacterized protein n=1 Tax=Gloeophyllum trabeum (strain ATCC 11539 / FP-39264 / Madison 617) TaxID=670483 RepID=S7RDQ1_GLOTA|nr:uncharacterized protein GLOTRDRAFT_133925 [Gloeophyllum trabeum ATCC 11539]EPQ50559.1 hypothetical protein GLOTRDRAFT_133925 [Gloeophyllum trabeum ATCC 11539]